jgi:hypothetical protein
MKCVRHRQQVEQDGAGDVVGQVAHHAQRPAGLRGQRREVHVQHVGLDHRQPGPAAGAQSRRQVAVELDHRQRAGALQQRLRHRAESGADLHQRVAGTRLDGAHDAADHALVGQEVLAETLPGEGRAVAAAHSGGSRNST